MQLHLAKQLEATYSISISLNTLDLMKKKDNGQIYLAFDFFFHVCVFCFQLMLRITMLCMCTNWYEMSGS